MKVTFDKDGYVEMLIMKGDLPNSIELEDDDTIDLNHLSYYKLGFDNTKLVYDAKKAERVESNSKANMRIYDLKKQVSDTDYKVLRHIRENALGIPTSMTQEEYLVLEAKRESLVRKVRELEDGVRLETDSNQILKEGYEAREEVKTNESTINNTVNIVVPELSKNIEEIISQSQPEIPVEKEKPKRKGRPRKKKTEEVETTEE